MPRSAANSRADRRRCKSSTKETTPPVADPEAEDIIPGCLTQGQWMDMLTQEDADETVGELMDELLSKVMEGCRKVYVERQLTPFSVSWAKSYLTQFLRRQIMCLDEGERPEEASKTEDSEPMPVPFDPWSQEIMPVVSATPPPQPASQQEVDIDQVPVQTEQRISEQCNVLETNISPKQSKKETHPRRPVLDKPFKVLSPRLIPKVDPKKEQQINSTPKPVPGKLLPPLPCPAEKKNVEVEGKNITHSVSNRMSGSLYKQKGYQTTPRLDPSRLPRHYVMPQYEILEHSYAKPNSKKPSGLSKIESRYSKRQTEWTASSVKPLTKSRDQPERFQRRSEADVLLRNLSQHRKEEMVSSGHLRLDIMKLAKGVSLLDPQAVDMSSFRFNPPAQYTKLRPIQSDVAVPLFSVEEVTTGPPPQVTLLFQSKNWDN